MDRHNLKIPLLRIVLVSIYIFGCSCECTPASEIPTSVDDYIENMSAHYKNEIQFIETDVQQMELSFNKQIALVIYNQELAAKLARQLESRMRSIASLHMKGKLCIQHYIANVTLEHVNLQTKLRACADAAKTNSRTNSDSARNQARNARAQLNDLVNIDLPTCRKNNANNEQKLVDCVKDKLKVREINVQNMMKATSKEIEAAVCRVDIIARTAQDCSFGVILGTHTLLSEIVTNINTCIGDRLLEMK